MATACDTENHSKPTLDCSETKTLLLQHSSTPNEQEMLSRQDIGSYDTEIYTGAKKCCFGISLQHLLGDQAITSNGQQCSEENTVKKSYSTYITELKQAFNENSISVETIKQSLQTLPCLTGTTMKQVFFHLSNKLLKADSINEVFEALLLLSSWYNNGFVSYLASQLLGKVGQDLTTSYLSVIMSFESCFLSSLPDLSSIMECPTEFEELSVKIDKAPATFTLQDINELHSNISNILGLQREVVLVTAVREAAVRGSIVVLRIPQIVGSAAITRASENTHMMIPARIFAVMAKYEVITPAMNQISRAIRQTIDSGCDVHLGSPDLTQNSFLTDFNHDSLDSSSDDVFLTAFSSTSSSSGVSSVNTTGNQKRNALSVLSPVVETNSKMSSSTGYSDLEDDKDAIKAKIIQMEKEDDAEEKLGKEDVDEDGQCESDIESEGISYAISSPQDFERANSVQQRSSENVSNVESFGLNNDDMRLMVTMAQQTKNRRVSKKTKAAPLPSKQRRASEESIYITMNSAPKISLSSAPQTPKTPDTNKVKLQASIPSSVHDKSTFSYRIAKGKQTGFVMRVLLRASPKFPANLQLISISAQQGSNKDNMLQVGQGERLTALYLKDGLIMARKGNGDQGKVPYTCCRLSCSYYGSQSKTLKLASSRLYNTSTINIQKATSTLHSTDLYDTSSPVGLDLVAIRSDSGEEKDELPVQTGDHLRLLYCDSDWVYASNQNQRAGFVPREHCRLKTKSAQLLKHCRWLVPDLPFQSDFTMALTQPPPPYLLNKQFVNSSDKGQKVIIMKKYTAPGTNFTFRRGLCVQVIYRESKTFLYVATTSGKCFWIPSSFCLSTLPEKLNSPASNDEVDHDTCMSSKSSGKKKVSFAKSASVVVESPKNFYRSNPELSMIPKEASSGKELQHYSTVPPRRTRSEDSFLAYLNGLEDHSPETTTCCFFCF